MRVLIADDHAIVRKGLRDILREASQTAVVGEASNGQEALALARSQPWDVVVLDITMPGLSGLAGETDVSQSLGPRPDPGRAATAA